MSSQGANYPKVAKKNTGNKHSYLWHGIREPNRPAFFIPARQHQSAYKYHLPGADCARS
ncbi:hypothetical protein J2X77_004071 [Sphingobacterium sp. 2149]|nr:hypothetical protein [Sphingobacterium sp. 2149]